MIRRYLSFADANPHLFVNPSEAVYSILLKEDEIQKVQEKTAERLKEKGLPIEWAQVGIVYEDQYLFILRDAVRFPDGYLSTYIREVEKESRVGGVVILPYYNGQIILIRHFRHATRSWHIEIPRGFEEAGVDKHENAKEELKEEIGANIKDLAYLGKMYIDTGITSSWANLYFASVETYAEPEMHEAITQLLPVDVSEFERMIRDGDISDSFTLATYTRAKLRGLL